MAKRARERSGFERLIDDFGQLVNGYADRIGESLQVKGQLDDAEVAGILSQGLKTQTAALSAAVGDAMTAATEPQRRELDLRTAGSGAPTLVQATLASMTTSRTARIGIVDILEPIKKIIKLLLDLLNEFGINLPRWISKLVDIINNLITGMLGMLGIDAGKRAERAQNLMYRHLREIYKTDAAAMALAGRGRFAEEDAAD